MEYICVKPCMAHRRIKRGEKLTEKGLALANGGVMPDEAWIKSNFQSSKTPLPMEENDLAVNLAQGKTPTLKELAGDAAMTAVDASDPSPVDADGSGYTTNDEMRQWLIERGQNPKASANKAELQAMIDEVKAASGDW